MASLTEGTEGENKRHLRLAGEIVHFETVAGTLP
ncbi:hypothetical protein HRbin36_00705 [bacterium HR36]|nr:hypothetical protein HRbin36_00705 [bacterium HR36]